MYTAKKFAFGNLDGISPKQLEVHIKLYEGYVTNLNLLTDTVAKYQQTDDDGGKYAVAEIRRRIGFEWNGMRMHEHYFSQWEGASSPIEGPLKDALTLQYGSYENWESEFKAVGMMRGTGWALLSYDVTTKNFITHFVADHELGQLNDTKTVLALDMWEHAYMVDYTPAEKKTYIEAFFKNLNGVVVSKRLTKATS